MSEHDDTLLDEDLGDEEYDLGNDEEEALLADDYEVERQNSYKGEEETDDVLDLGVTDALDDLEGDDENVEFNRRKTDQCNENSFYKEEEHEEARGGYYEQDEANEYHNEQVHRYETDTVSDNINTINPNIPKGDLREKLQKNIQKAYIGDGQGMEDDEGEEAKERRNRFQNERTMISPKMNNDIPDSLENVVTSEQGRPPFRGRGRGRGSRGSRGGRFIAPNAGNFNPRFGAPRGPSFENQQPVCRPPLLENRPPFLLGLSSGIQNQQMMFQQSNPQVQPFQQFSPNGPPQGPPHFIDNRPPFNPNQFQGPIGPRPVGPRLEFEPRGSIGGPMQGSSFNCPPNQPPYIQMQPPFPNSGGIIQENQGRPLPNNQGPLLHGNPGASLLGNPNSLISGNPAPVLQGNQPLSMQGFPRQQAPPAQLPLIQNHPNAQIPPGQIPFENRPSYQESHFDSRPGYVEQPPSSQFNNNALPISQQQPPPPPTSIPNVPLPPGHKILINPHFRGAVQPTNDSRLWDSAQHQAPPQPLVSSSQFNHPSAPYQNQNSYNQSQQGSSSYQQNYTQSKNNDPYAYFSDMWQENRPQKPSNVSPSKQYSVDSNYSRESTYSDSGNKYKDSQWEDRDYYQEEHRGFHQSYRDRDLPPKSRNNNVQKLRPSSSSTYRGDNYDPNQKSPSNRSMNTMNRGVNRVPQKRLSETSDRTRDTSPKRSKTGSRHLQEVQTVDIPSDTVNEKKDEDSDPEMQEYRKKMEEQKKLREKILREKENRRKMAAMEKQNEEAKNESSTATAESTQESKPVSILMSVKDTATNKGRIATGIGRGRGRPVNAQTTEASEKASGVRIVRTIQTLQSNDSINLIDSKDNNTSSQAASQMNDSLHSKSLNPQPGTRRVIIQKTPLSSQKMTTTIQKTVSNMQASKSQMSVQNKVLANVQTVGQKIMQNQSTGILKKTIVAQKPVNSTQRIVCQKPIGGLQKTVINVQEVANANAQKVIVNTQSNQRVVLQKPSVQVKKIPEIKTNTVKVENLAASTSEAQIRRMCQGIGTIESIHMGEGNATIVFKTQSAAMVFHKKYQRKMLDLSLITVHLVPQTSANKATAVVKKS